jgi:hypothetical protein
MDSYLALQFSSLGDLSASFVLPANGHETQIFTSNVARTTALAG